MCKQPLIKGRDAVTRLSLLKLDIEQKIKNYLYFHLSNENKEVLKKYLTNDNHFKIEKELLHSSGDGIDKIMPKTELVNGLVGLDYKFREGFI